MDTSITRRQFLRGAFRRREAIHRPPWALPEPAFLARCDRCGACVQACSSRLIALTDSGYPRLDFRDAGCTFCGNCVAACVPGALFRAAGSSPPWRLRASAGESCLATRGVLCRVCGERCEAGTIRFTPTLGAWPAPVFDPEGCTGCGTCVGACPADAITLREPADRDLPKEAACT